MKQRECIQRSKHRDVDKLLWGDEIRSRDAAAAQEGGKAKNLWVAIMDSRQRL